MVYTWKQQYTAGQQGRPVGTNSWYNDWSLRLYRRSLGRTTNYTHSAHSIWTNATETSSARFDFSLAASIRDTRRRRLYKARDRHLAGCRLSGRYLVWSRDPNADQWAEVVYCSAFILCVRVRVCLLSCIIFSLLGSCTAALKRCLRSARMWRSVFSFRWQIFVVFSSKSPDRSCLVWAVKLTHVSIYRSEFGHP